jgi:DNA-binding NarL/FixJ family response regulator
MELIPILYHPTTITIIDDDPGLLNNLSLSLSAHFKCRPFSSAIEGKDALIKDHKKLRQNKYLNVSYEDLTQVSIDLKISDIYKEIYNDNRFSPSVIAILDYEMPEKNGLVLARELKEKIPNIKIIMFTGEANHETATAGFNKNEIDRFIQKNTPNYEETLISYINELTREFFIQAFAGFLDYVKNRQGHPLQDPDFITILNQTARENNIVEYYLLDDSGSFLMLDSLGKPTWLIDRTEEDMRTYYDLAEDDGASSDILESLNKREKIVLFSNENTAVPSLEKWHFYPADKIKNKKLYYCVLKENEPPLRLKNIKNYKQFLMS